MAAYELFDSRDCSLSRSSASGSRVFLVDSDPELATQDVELPAIGSTFTFNGKVLKLDRIDTKRTNRPGYSEAKLLYSDNASFDLPGPPDTGDPAYKTYNIQQLRVNKRIPAFQSFIDYVYPESGVGPPVVTVRWEPVEFDPDVFQTQIEVTVNLNTLSGNMLSLIRGQIGNIHVIPNVGPSRLTGARSTRTKVDQWQITYAWVSDAGFPDISGTVPDFESTLIIPSTLIRRPDGSEFDPSGGGNPDPPSGSYLFPAQGRPPFWEFTVAAAEMPGDYPTIGLLPASMFYPIVPSGWLSLPGSPIP